MKIALQRSILQRKISHEEHYSGSQKLREVVRRRNTEAVVCCLTLELMWLTAIVVPQRVN